ncbi:LPS translocon maturation chaperone LptM [Sulfuricella denitrificans]|nr:lipoprotein [Sulfuricella denitrificans]
MRFVFLPVLLLILLQGCGHKGALYLPTPEQTSAATTPAAPQAAAEEKKP